MSLVSMNTSMTALPNTLATRRSSMPSGAWTSRRAAAL
jgi:hypothetical protein